jgi:hypothetical protein
MRAHRWQHAGLLTLVTALGCAHPAGRSTARRFDPPADWFDSLLVQQTSEGGIRYADVYERALKRDPRGLSGVLEATIHTDAAGAELQADILWDFLQSWGDSAFASVLQGRSGKVRHDVVCSLDTAADSTWAWAYPRTAALAPFDPNCGGVRPAAAR